MTTARADPAPAQPPTVVRIGSPPELCQAVPYLVGFEPEESIVVISLRGERKRMGLVMRVDLPPPRHARRLAGLLVGHLVNDGAAAAAVVVYSERSSTSPDRAARAVLQELARASIAVEEGLRVSGGVWTSYTCSKACCPQAGTPLPDRTREPGVFGAAMVAQGRRVLPSRRAMVATLDRATGDLAEAMMRALREQTASPHPPTDPAYAAETIELAREWSKRLEDPRQSMTVDAAARLLVGLTDRDVRDAMLPWTIGDHPQADLGPAAATLWTELARRAVLPGLAAAPATLLAWHCYLNAGDGAMANIAIEKALNDQPDYVMAGYLLVLLEQAIAPRVFEDWIAGTPASDGPFADVG